MFGAIAGAVGGVLGGSDIIGKLTDGLFGDGKLGKLLGGGLSDVISKLFGGDNKQQGAEGLLGDIKDLLSQLVDKEGQCGCSGHGDMHGTPGSDHMHGGRGRDHMDGGRGDDDMRGGRGRDHMDGGRGDDDMRGGRGRDHMDGGRGDDDMRGGRGRDHMNGGRGDDDMWGGRGRDVLDGGRGDDNLYGGRGKDVLKGGEGHNHLDGGRGSDRYIIETGSDNIITDGSGKKDTVVLDGNRDDYTFERRGDDLVVTDEDGTRVVIKDQFNGGGVDRLKFDDGTVKADDFEELVADDNHDCACDHDDGPPRRNLDEIDVRDRFHRHIIEDGEDFHVHHDHRDIRPL